MATNRQVAANRITTSNRLLSRDFGKCLFFDNSGNAYVTKTGLGNQLVGASGITIGGWINPVNISGLSGYMGIRRPGSFIDTDDSFYILNLGNGTFECRFRNSAGTNYDLNSSTSYLNFNNWNHLMMTYNGSTLVFYINGTSIGNISASGSFQTENSSTPDFSVGRDGGNNNNAKMIYADEIMVFSRGLSASEVSNLYKTGQFDSTGNILHWKFDEGSGTTANDSSGNGNNGTITGAVYSSNVPMKERASVS